MCSAENPVASLCGCTLCPHDLQRYNLIEMSPLPILLMGSSAFLGNAVGLTSPFKPEISIRAVCTHMGWAALQAY